MLLLVVLMGAGISYWLKVFTRHGESVTVPNLQGLATNEVSDFLAERNLQVLIIDSIYDLKRPKGTVVDQDPRPDAQVKRGRTIYITVNAYNPPTILMPTLVDLSQRQALAVLESYGLKLGNMSYIPDACRNCVLKQVYKGKDIQAGTPIEKGSRIDLVLGQGESNEKTIVPSLIGFTREQAINTLQQAFLNIGAEIYDAGIVTSSDSAKARVYKQSPIRMNDYPVSLGSPVDLWFTLDTNLIKAGSIYNDTNDDEDFN